jgi:hypothetical protein
VLLTTPMTSDTGLARRPFKLPCTALCCPVSKHNTREMQGAVCPQRCCTLLWPEFCSRYLKSKVHSYHSSRNRAGMSSAANQRPALLSRRSDPTVTFCDSSHFTHFTTDLVQPHVCEYYQLRRLLLFSTSLVSTPLPTSRRYPHSSAPLHLRYLAGPSR